MIVAAALFQAPDAIIVSGFGGLIISLAQVSKAGGRRGSRTAFLVYLGEISYSVYMVCIPWEVLFVNVAAKIGISAANSCRRCCGWSSSLR